MKKVILGIVFLVFVLNFQFVFADGTCGNNVKYSINNNTINFSRERSGSEAVWGTDCGEVFKTDLNITVVNINERIRVTDGKALFDSYRHVKEMNLENFDVSNVTDMTDMFYMCESMETLNVSSWNTANVTSIRNIFSWCTNLKNLDVSRWNTSKMKDISSAFAYCRALRSLDVSGWNTSSVTDMYGTFYTCPLLTRLDLSGWNTSNVEDMGNMFAYCNALKSLNVSGWNTSKVFDMEKMFYDCTNLKKLDLSSWDTSGLSFLYDKMFFYCRLETISLGKNTLKTNIFDSLYTTENPTWYYIAPGSDAVNPIPYGSVRENDSLFTSYYPNEMAGTWSTKFHLDLPFYLEEIQASAFEGSTSITEVVLPDGMTTIGSRAFANCSKLKIVHIPDSVQTIGEDAFVNDFDVVLYCQSEENACVAYASNHHIDYIIE